MTRMSKALEALLQRQQSKAGELKHQVEQLEAENVRLKKMVALMQRKQEHGCTDANCDLCDCDGDMEIMKRKTK